MTRMTELDWRDELVFDHAFLLVADLDEAERRLRREFGFGAVALGRFTEFPDVVNRIVPMRDCYLELLSVMDRGEDTSEAARFWLQRLGADGEHVAGWAVRTDRLEEAAAGLGLEIEGPERQTIDGEDFEVRWSVLWPYEDPPHVPFLIQYEDFARFRNLLDRKTADAGHRRSPIAVSGVRAGGDPEKVRARIGSRAWFHPVSGPERVVALKIATAEDSVDLRWERGTS
jgi:hypothetical protein